MFFRPFAALILSALCLAAVPALAEDGGFYASAGASFSMIQVQDYKPIDLVDGGGNDYRDDRRVHDGSAQGPMGGLTMGWKHESGLFFEAAGFTASPESRQNRVLNIPAGFNAVGMMTLDGMNTTAFAADLTTSTKLSLDQFGGEVLAGYEIPLAQGFSASPFVGYFCMELDQAYSLLAYPTIAPGSAFHRSEELNTTYFGPEAGLRLEYGDDLLRARLAGTLGWAQADTRYHGEDWGTLNDALDLDHNDSGLRSRLEGGVDLLLGDWTLGLDAGVEYFSYAPGIEASTATVATRIKPSDATAGRVGLNIGYAF